MIVSAIGNKELLKAHKTAFLCSRDIPASVVLKCYDWAIEQRDKGVCVISGFHSKIEKDVFHFLLAGTQPIIMALARGMKARIEPELNKEIDKGRLLIVTPFEKDIKHVTSKTAEIRNRFMIDMADEVAVGFVRKGGMLEPLVLEIQEDKEYKIFSVT
jgi:predicted Rossmann fold nucleotide-binding protein DprA/Smf involved in DNA uptake